MFWSLAILHKHSTQEPASFVCNDEQGNLFYSSAGPHRNQSQPTQKKLRRDFGQNEGEWTRRVKISKEEVPGSRHSTHGYIQTCSRLKRENF